MAVDWAVISDLEGGQILEGYVPLSVEVLRPGRKKGNWQYYGDVEPTQKILDNVAGASGLTIGTGVDLGSKTSAWLASLGGALPQKLGPFLGLVGKKAIAKLWETRGVRITTDEAGKIDQWAFAAYARTVQLHFDADTKGRAWLDLTSSVQTALTSVHYNHGVIWSHLDTKTTRQLWKHVIANKWWSAYTLWKGMAESLPAGQSTKRSRTRREAELLRPTYLDLDMDDESGDQL